MLDYTAWRSFDDRLTKISNQQKTIIKLLHQIQKEGAHMSQELDTLTATVNDTLGVEESAIVLIEGLAAKLTAIANDPAAILALSAELSAKKDELAAAVAANTPA